MTTTDYDEYGQAARRLRVDTLIRLRWIAVTGQLIATLGVYYILNFDLPIGQCLVAIGTSAALNIALRIGTPRSFRLNDTEAAALLGYDILQLAVLLYLTGGVINSFTMLFLTPIMIAAVSLPRNLSSLLGILMIAAATFLTVEFEPLPWRPYEPLSFPLLYRASVWVSLALSAAFIGTYAARVSEEARLLAAALAATELVLERAQHLSQLDGLAAAAAHELGTPLATITLITKEMQKAAATTAPALEEDLALLAQEARRCREILRKLNSLGADTGEVMNRLSLGALIEEVVQEQGDPDIPFKISRSGPEPQPACPRNPGILYGLGNLVENAMDFAKTAVQIDVRWTKDLVVIVIEDDGPGFAPGILDRLGDPYVSGRFVDRRKKGEPGAGLGLGLFIAKTLLERSGAMVQTANKEAPRTGARVTISWPRSVFERTPSHSEARGPLSLTI